LHKPVVSEYCTDLFEYIDLYPLAPPVLAILAFALPFIFKLTKEEARLLRRSWQPGRSKGSWGREMVKNNLTVLHAHCNAVISHSRKSTAQLKSWQSSVATYPIEIIPTGVDAPPAVTDKEVKQFKRKWNVKDDDEVIAYFGRVSPEKNLGLLIKMFEIVAQNRPKAKLFIMGASGNYGAKLAQKAAATSVGDRIVLTGRYDADKLAMWNSASKVFAFPSLTDTQAVAIHEAARLGLPTVMIDEQVTEVIKDGKNGYFCKNDPADMAEKVERILSDDKLRTKMSAESRRSAALFSERNQAKKITLLYKKIIAEAKAHYSATVRL
jgi:glycosyltransferase involved in cell wall biosynthesis